MTPALPRTREAVLAFEAGTATRDDVAEAFVVETATYNRPDSARELVASDAGLRWLRETFGSGEPFCACGRIVSRCDGSRAGCRGAR